MKIRADEHVSPEIVDTVRRIALSPGWSFDHLYESGHKGASDVHWITAFAKDGGNAILSLKAVVAASALLNRYFVPMAERAYGDAAMPEAERLAATVARWIIKTRATVINARDLRRKERLPGLKDAAKVRLALGALEEADWISPAFSRDGGGPGRQREDYRVNPAVWEAAR